MSVETPKKAIETDQARILRSAIGVDISLVVGGKTEALGSQPQERNPQPSPKT